MTLLVLVPRPGSVADRVIDKGSGVVAEAASLDMTGLAFDAYFEGNRYGAANLQTFEQRVESAAGRLRARYPTVARGWFACTDWLIVGTYTYLGDGPGRLHVHQQDALDAWLQEGA